jgi:hypothetical protein
VAAVVALIVKVGIPDDPSSWTVPLVVTVVLALVVSGAVGVVTAAQAKGAADPGGFAALCPTTRRTPTSSSRVRGHQPSGAPE